MLYNDFMAPYVVIYCAVPFTRSTHRTTPQNSNFMQISAIFNKDHTLPVRRIHHWQLRVYTPSNSLLHWSLLHKFSHRSDSLSLLFNQAFAGHCVSFLPNDLKFVRGSPLPLASDNFKWRHNQSVAQSSMQWLCTHEKHTQQTLLTYLTVSTHRFDNDNCGSSLIPIRKAAMGCSSRWATQPHNV
jgi:hypothetical protein